MEPNEYLVRKFLEDRLSEEELELLQAYFKTPAGLSMLERIMDENAAAFEKPLMPFKDPRTLRDRENIPAARTRSIYRIGAIAASTIAVLAIAFIYVFIYQSTSAVVYKTLPGEKVTVTLPDETVVMLNGNSILSYDQDTWDTQQLRPVHLAGEAYFKVRSDKTKPFVVNTSGITIRVLGTTFNVKSYDEDREIETTLIEGRVLIENDGAPGQEAETLELLPEQKATFTKSNRTLALKTITADRAAGWVSGTLVFEDEAFSDIIKDLERWYGVSIVVREKAAMSCRFNSKIEHESLEDVLKMFSATSDMKYFFRDKTHVVIEGNVCADQAEHQPSENNDETGY